MEPDPDNNSSFGTEQKGRSVAAHAINFRSIAPIVIACLGFIVFLDWAQAVLLPLVAGIMISYALDPLVSLFDRISMPRPISAAIVLSGLVAVLVLAAIPLQTQTMKMVERIPDAVRQFERESAAKPQSEGMMEKAQEAAKEIEESASKSEEKSQPSRVQATAVRVVDEPFSIREYLLDRASGAIIMVAQLFSVLFLVYFVLATGKLYKRKVVRLSGPGFHGMRRAARMLNEFHAQMRRFIFVMLLGAVFVGVVTWLSFIAMGVEQSLLWGVIAGVASAIPYLGPLLVFLGAGAAAFIQFGSLDMAILVSGVSLVITSIQGNLLTPWLTSRVSSLNPVVIFIGLLFWGWLWGPVGLILATPILMMTKTLCDHVKNLQGLGELLGK
ncbi:Predicted PurR-regulated permease PerM [Marinobacter daqiaonensis]|uniref:Predicted PurR-regulated permease PerM n=1 Tax=Marinobacter daqiaonensis TaxID=650891 RepID=A0A1I6I6U3_9GAMM|nr:AI-2E family transporter [Marinobacter daqiaonensis]SFR62452.1 Predicted PurR-regulated permease PerM [Marinobacter daqiaonensis]